MSDTTETTFDMNAHFASIPSDPKKSALFAALYEIDSICRREWATMGPTQTEIMDAVERALDIVRSL